MGRDAVRRVAACRADTVVLLDVPRRVSVAGVLRRWARHRGRAVQAAGCPERPSGEFLRWVWGYPTGGRVRALTTLAAHPRRAEVELVTLRSRAEARRWLDRVAPRG